MINRNDLPTRVELSDVQVGDKIRLDSDDGVYEFTVSAIDNTHVYTERVSFSRHLTWMVTLLERPAPPLPTKVGRYRAGVEHGGYHRFFMRDRRGTWWDIGNEDNPYMREKEPEDVARYGPLVPLVVSDG